MLNPSPADSGTLADLLDEGLRVRPDEPAILDLGQAHTFRDLHRSALTIAAFMAREHHVGPGDRVVVAVAKSPLIVAIALACWKLGAIYVPLDPDSPAKRCTTILESIRPSLVVGPKALLSAWTQRSAGLRQESYEHLRALEMLPDLEFMAGPNPEGAAVIIHTSGSTGAPKGVVLSHASVVSYLRNHNEYLGFSHSSVGMNNAPFYFDVSIQDTFLPLYFGASVLFHRGLWVGPLIIELIRRYGVTHLIAVSSILKVISSDGACIRTLQDSTLRVVVTGGEVCPPRLINLWLETVPGLRVLYGYGPTELNSLCTTHVITRPEPERTSIFPIGKPFRDHRLVLLDDARCILYGDGVVGTLAVSGPQMMMGYWKDPVLTARVMLLHEGQRYYVTGDRCRRDIEGNYHFEGRMDAEVKIRGRRINLNEIRNALVAHDNVAHAVVSVIQTGEDIRITAAVHIPMPAADSEASLRSWLADCVPGYMVPWYIGVFPRPPRTATDKLDERWMVQRLQALAQDHPSQRDFRVVD
jgi:amino acid adenylation domain-containing protein